MLLPLLLDAAPATQGTPVTVYVTIGAAVLAALASLNAARISSNTAREVAALSAQTARDAAALTAQTTRDIKDKDYKNDYYKKIIDRRMKAIEKIENIIEEFLHVYSVGSPGETTLNYDSNDSCHTYFLENSKFINPNKFSLFDKERTPEYAWISKDLLITFNSFVQTILKVVTDAGRFKEDNNSKLSIYIGNFNIIEQKRIAVERCISKDMENLYDVEAFFKAKHSTN